MCDELQKMGDILACYAVNKDGRLLGASYGEMKLDEKLKADLSHIASDVWVGLERITNLGLLRSVEVIYENFKILGLAIQRTNVAILLTVEVKLDSYVLKERVLDFVSYWLKVNHYIE
jgi:hypothetical protein